MPNLLFNDTIIEVPVALDPTVAFRVEMDVQPVEVGAGTNYLFGNNETGDAECRAVHRDVNRTRFDIAASTDSGTAEEAQPFAWHRWMIRWDPTTLLWELQLDGAAAIAPASYASPASPAATAQSWIGGWRNNASTFHGYIRNVKYMSWDGSQIYNHWPVNDGGNTITDIVGGQDGTIVRNTNGSWRASQGYLGYQQLAVSTSVVDIDDLYIASDASHAELQAETQPIRYTMDDTTDPTQTSGMVLLVADEPLLVSKEDLVRVRFIRGAGSDALLNVHYLGVAS